MTAIVRIFTHSSTLTAPVQSGSGVYSTDSLMLLKQPYLARQSISVDSGAAQSSSPATSPSKTGLAYIQVESGKAVHLEVNPPGRFIAADTSSPIVTGNVIFEFGPGWTISVLEATT